jgi:Flp pilus assembly protein CpaB
LLVDPEESERLTLASTEGKIQLALRNPLDKATPVTRGIRPAVLLGVAAVTPRATGRVVAAGPKAAAPVVSESPTVEMIRGDKRAHELVRQEPQ